MPKDRGQNKDMLMVHFECSLALGMVAAEARLHVAGSGRNRAVGWCQQSGIIAKTYKFMSKRHGLAPKLPARWLGKANRSRHLVPR